MNRRSFLIAAAAFALLSTTAEADEDYVTHLVDLLKKQGFADIAVTRTLLGRVRIVGVNSKGTRELICNPRTGEILRDVLTADDGTSQTVAATVSSNGSSGSSGNGGSGNGDDGGNDQGGNDQGDDDKGENDKGDDGNHGDGDNGGGNDNSEHEDSGGSGDGGGGDNSGHGSGHDD